MGGGWAKCQSARAGFPLGHPAAKGVLGVKGPDVWGQVGRRGGLCRGKRPWSGGEWQKTSAQLRDGSAVTMSFGSQTISPNRSPPRPGRSASRACQHRVPVRHVSLAGDYGAREGDSGSRPGRLRTRRPLGSRFRLAAVCRLVAGQRRAGERLDELSRGPGAGEEGPLAVGAGSPLVDLVQQPGDGLGVAMVAERGADMIEQAGKKLRASAGRPVKGATPAPASPCRAASVPAVAFTHMW